MTHNPRIETVQLPGPWGTDPVVSFFKVAGAEQASSSLATTYEDDRHRLMAITPQFDVGERAILDLQTGVDWPLMVGLSPEDPNSSDRDMMLYRVDPVRGLALPDTASSVGVVSLDLMDVAEVNPVYAQKLEQILLQARRQRALGVLPEL